MPRKHLRKTERGRCEIGKYEQAYVEVKRGISLRRAAEMHEVNRMSLLRYIRKRDEAGADHSKDSISMGYVAHNKVFSEEQEQQLSRYITPILFDLFQKLPKEKQEVLEQKNLQFIQTRLK